MHYLSDPPKVKCLITDKYRYYTDECDCDDSAAICSDVLAKLREEINKPGAIMAINYDGPNAPSVAFGGTLTEDEAALAAASYEKLLNLPLYGDCEVAQDNKISVKPVTSTIDLDTIDERLLAPSGMYATRCLVCAADVPVYFLGGGPKICRDCKKAIEFIRTKFKEELDNYEM
jgi:hypothetical protein